MSALRCMSDEIWGYEITVRSFRLWLTNKCKLFLEPGTFRDR